ncbi:MAG: glycosyltransferase [Sedimentisphaerales bacterium]|nr:glycosyltransferase [Sedimentisphaerales bacterium]
MAKLSVIIASYNHQDYIAETLRSIEGQTFQDFEIILVDDGSGDRTVEIARGVRSRARIFTQPNRGVVAARNRGVELAQGQYICFVDSDDVILPTRFEKQVTVLDGEPEVGLIFADAWIINAAGQRIGRFSDVYRVIPGDVAEMLMLHYCFTPMITVMVRADVLRRTGPFHRPGPISDYMKWIEVAHISRTHYDAEPLGCWRRHVQSTSKKANKVKSYARTRAACKKLLRKYPDLEARIGRAMTRRFSRSYFLTAFWLAADGDVRRARKYYWKAIKLAPRSMANWGGYLVALFPMKRVVTGVHRYVRAKKLPW